MSRNNYPPSAYYLGKGLAIAGIWIGVGWAVSALSQGPAAGSAPLVALFAMFATIGVAAWRE